MIWGRVKSGIAGRGPLPGLETGLSSDTGKWIVRGDACGEKARDFIGKGRPGGEQESKGTQEDCSATWLAVSGFYGDGTSFRVVFSQSFWLRVLPGGACPVQPRWMPERRMLGGGRTCGVSFWPFLNSSGCWRLISSVFLTRTSCRKTAHADGYYGAWRVGGFVSVSVLPLTVGADTVRKKSELCGLGIPPMTQKKTVLHRTPTVGPLGVLHVGCGCPEWPADRWSWKPASGHHRGQSAENVNRGPYPVRAESGNQRMQVCCRQLGKPVAQLHWGWPPYLETPVVSGWCRWDADFCGLEKFELLLVNSRPHLKTEKACLQFLSWQVVCPASSLPETETLHADFSMKICATLFETESYLQHSVVGLEHKHCLVMCWPGLSLLLWLSLTVL